MTWQMVTSMWHWHPSAVWGCIALVVGYAAALRFRLPTRAPAFVAGVAVLLIALVSPIHTLSDTYLFSAHMLQHLLLLLIVPPLLLLGLPGDLVQRGLRYKPITFSARILTLPIVAWLIGIGAMWLWHLPALYEATLSQQWIHIFEHLCFLAAAVIFWWPIFVQSDELRLAPLPAMLYLFTGMLAGGVLGMILTFAAPGWYPSYLNPRDPFRILPIIRDAWGLTPAVDQQVGGLLMWVPGSLVYLAAIIAMLTRWYGAPEELHEIPSKSMARDAALEQQPRRTIDVV